MFYSLFWTRRFINISIKVFCNTRDHWNVQWLKYYQWINGVDNLPQEYEYLADYVLATFRQDRKDKSKYHVYLVSKETFASDNPGDVAMRKNKELVLNTNDREKLELFMISHPQIKYCGNMI